MEDAKEEQQETTSGVLTVTNKASRQETTGPEQLDAPQEQNTIDATDETPKQLTTGPEPLDAPQKRATIDTADATDETPKQITTGPEQLDAPQTTIDTVDVVYEPSKQLTIGPEHLDEPSPQDLETIDADISQTDALLTLRTRSFKAACDEVLPEGGDSSPPQQLETVDIEVYRATIVRRTMRTRPFREACGDVWPTMSFSATKGESKEISEKIPTYLRKLMCTELTLEEETRYLIKNSAIQNIVEGIENLIHALKPLDQEQRKESLKEEKQIEVIEEIVDEYDTKHEILENIKNAIIQLIAALQALPRPKRDVSEEDAAKKLMFEAPSEGESYEPRKVPKECEKFLKVDDFAQILIDDVVRTAISTERSLQAQSIIRIIEGLEYMGTSQESALVQTIRPKPSEFELPTIEEFTPEMGSAKIEEYLSRWKLEDDWKFCVKYVKSESDKACDFHRFDAIFSIPCKQYPIPQATATLYFTYEISRVKPRHCFVDVNGLLLVRGATYEIYSWTTETARNMAV